MNVSIDRVYSQLDSTYKELPENTPHPLNDEQKARIRTILEQVNTASSDQLNALVKKIAGNPAIIRIVRSALGETNDSLAKQLKSVTLVEDFATAFFTDNSLKWLTNNPTSLSQETFDSMPKESKFYLTALLAQIPQNERTPYQELYSRLDTEELAFFASKYSIEKPTRERILSFSERRRFSINGYLLLL